MSVDEPLIGSEYDEDAEYYSDTAHSSVYLQVHRRSAINKKLAKKRADVLINARSKARCRIQPSGEVWAACAANEIRLERLQQVARRKVLTNGKLELRLEQFFSDVFIGHVLVERKRSSPAPIRLECISTGVEEKNMAHSMGCGLVQTVSTETMMAHSTDAATYSANGRRCQVFLFKFGCVSAWDLPRELRGDLMALLDEFLEAPQAETETDSMSYVWGYDEGIKEDVIHLVTTRAEEEPTLLRPEDRLNHYRTLTTEKLAYSYGLAQSCKLSVFEENIEKAIAKTRKIPESLAKTGTVCHYSRTDISSMIGELFMNRFNMNLQCDMILDTPDIFWEENEHVLQYYTVCRNYLELSKRIEHLNQRLDIIKDLYDILNQELTIQHGYKLEWIVIYLILVEIVIEVVWNILVKDTFRWV